MRLYQEIAADAEAEGLAPGFPPQVVALLADWAEHPVHFVTGFLGATPDPWQCDVLDDLADPGILRVALRSCHGPGKAQPVDLIVDTPDGPRKFGDLQVGDRVFGGDGQPTAVIGVFDQGVKPVFRVTMNDRTSTLCCAEHLWTVRERGRAWQTLPLAALAQRGVDRPNGRRAARRFEIPMTGWDYPWRWVLADPYTLGAWIGDGTRRTGLITGNDAEVGDRAEAAGYEIRRFRRRGVGYISVYGLTRALRALRLFDCGSAERFVPAAYRYNARIVREEILRGLLDSDGFVDAWGSMSYSTVSARLAEQVAWLVRSLGGVARVRRGERRTGTDWRVSITMPEGRWCYVERKHARYRPVSQKRYLSRWIAAIAPVGEVPCRCIRVESEDGLYLANDGIVMHNTTLEAWAVTWFMTTRPLSKVPTTAPTFARQVRDLLWAEIAKWWRNGQRVAPWFAEQFELQTTRLQARGYPDWYAVGIASREAVNMEGYHAPHILVVFDEAKGIRKPAWDAVRGMQAKHLVASTPAGKLGEFYKVFTQYRSTWKRLYDIHPRCLQGHPKLSAEVVGRDPETGAATPGQHARGGTYFSDRVPAAWVEDHRLELGEDNPVFVSRVMGEFPEIEGDVLLPASWLERAMAATQGTPGPRWVSVDVARHGRDRTVFLAGEGGTLLHCETVARYADETTARELQTIGVGPDPRHPLYRTVAATALICKRLHRDWGAEGVAVDDSGVGGGVTDWLRWWGIPVVAVNFGAAPTDKPRDSDVRAMRARRGQLDTVFANLKAQMGVALQRAFESDSLALGRLPRHVLDALVAQASQVGVEYDVLGRLRLVDPDEREDEAFPGAAEMEGQRSPDHFHALLIYWWVAGKYYKPMVPRAAVPQIPAHIAQIGEPARAGGMGAQATRAPAAGKVGGQAGAVQRRYER